MTTIGKNFTKSFYDTGDTKLYPDYQGCSEGGRECFSRVQRFADAWHGAVIGAPAIHVSFQKIQHLYSNVVEQTLNYHPPACELDKIVNATIAAYDPSDGNTDGVVSRSDLCRLHFDSSSIIAQPQSCAAPNSTSGVSGLNQSEISSGGAFTSAHNGTVLEEWKGG